MNEKSFEAEFKLDIPPSSSGLTSEHCRANRVQIEDIGRGRHQQVRIEFPSANGVTTSAIYTVTKFHNDAKLVALGDKIQYLLPNCQLSENKCKGVVKAHIMIEGIDDDETAKKRGELIEDLNHDGQNRKLVVIAPHGGEIEENTDEQAEYVWSRLSPHRMSLWTCKGFSSEGRSDAFERWHITSTEISEKLFPKFNTIFGPKFEYSIAFHGWKQDSICVGGSTNNVLKGEIKDKIKSALKAKGSNIDARDSDCPDDFNGCKQTGHQWYSNRTTVGSSKTILHIYCSGSCGCYASTD
jgi:phage replication-related protein YjqB (UPF0714/DUF867 family)